jgi:hypothetical protein
VLAIVIAVVTGVDWIGKPLHLVHVLTLVAAGVVAGSQLPNKRLKLAGGDRFKGSGVFAPWRAPTVVHCSCAGGRVARSLSAIR